MGFRDKTLRSFKEALKNDVMRGNKESPPEPRRTSGRQGDDEVDEARRVFQRFPKSFVLGVTGVIGSGKSTLCRFLKKEYGFYWIEADKIAHELYKKGRIGYKIIKKHFGPQFVGSKCVNRNRLRQLVLKNPQKLLVLNKLIHPLVVQEANKKLVQLKRLNKTKKPLRVCIEAIYFDKKNLGKFVDRVIAVDASDNVIKKRLKKRRITVPELKKLLEFQRRQGAYTEIVLNNNKSPKHLFSLLELPLVQPL